MFCTSVSAQRAISPAAPPPFPRRQGYSVGALHGNSSQAVREWTVEQFKTGEIPIMVATDVASRARRGSVDHKEAVPRNRAGREGTGVHRRTFSHAQGGPKPPGETPESSVIASLDVPQRYIYGFDVVDILDILDMFLDAFDILCAWCSTMTLFKTFRL